MNLKELTIESAATGLAKGEFSARELVLAANKRITERNSTLNAFISFDEELALAEADKADARIRAGDHTVLTGIPFGVKDAICTHDLPSTGAAKILEGYNSPHEATVVSNIRRLGAVLVGKQNCDAFGHGASNENSMYGPVRNPFDESRVAGGSSGGSAASLADGQCLFSVAEDTGGSIRFPAAFCGVAGLRPTYGRNSRFGLMPMASSLDAAGPIAVGVRDLAIVAEAMAGFDPKDASSLDESVPKYLEGIEDGVKGKKIGVPREYFELEGLDPEVATVAEQSLALWRELGAEIVEISLPHTKYAIPTYYILVPSEDSSNLARLDGLRYGQFAPDSSLAGAYAKARSQGFPEEVKRRIMIGTYALSAGYLDAFYKKASRVRTLIAGDFEHAFQHVDFIFTPTAPFPAFKVGEKSQDVLSMYLSDVFVSPSALAGLPALSLPAGQTAGGLPIGMQIIGPRLSDHLVLRAARALEKGLK